MQTHESYKQRYRQIIGALPCAYVSGEVIVNGRGDPVDYAVSEINHAFTELTGLSADKVRGKRIPGLFSISSTREDIEVFARVALTGEPIEKEFLSPAFGMHFRLLCFSQSSGGFTALLTDLTGWKKCQERFRFLEAFANSTSDEFYVLDSSGKFIMGNEETARRLGLSKNRLPGKHISILNPVADQEWWTTLWSSLTKKGSLQFETEHRDAEGEMYPVEISVDLMESGSEVYAAMVAKNISGKRALSSALMKDRQLAGKAAAMAGYLIWMLEPTGFFRPLIGGDDQMVPGPLEEVFLPSVHRDDRRPLKESMANRPEASMEIRLKTGRGYIYHRIVWSKVEQGCISGICYPLPGAGLAGSGSDSGVMEGYCMMTEAIFRKLQKSKDALEAGRMAMALRSLRSVTSEFALLTGQSVFPERVRLDSFLLENTGMLQHLLEPDIPVEVETADHSTGLIDPTYLENILARFLLVIRNTGLVSRVHLRSGNGGRNALIQIILDGVEGIHAELDRNFIPVRGDLSGLASVYAMVRSAGGSVRYETRDNRITFTLAFQGAMMDDEGATILIALPGSVDSARIYAALRSEGYSVAIETGPEEIRRRFSRSGVGILIASDSMAEFSLEELGRELPGVKIIQAGGKPAGNFIHLSDGFRTGDVLQLVRQVLSTVETPLEEDLQDGILWGESHLTPPLS